MFSKDCTFTLFEIMNTSLMIKESLIKVSIHMHFSEKENIPRSNISKYQICIKTIKKVKIEVFKSPFFIPFVEYHEGDKNLVSLIYSLPG